jgi:hypothetical protein
MDFAGNRRRSAERRVDIGPVDGLRIGCDDRRQKSDRSSENLDGT